MINLFNYIERKSPVHQLTGATKFIALLLWNFAAMLTFDTRFLVGLSILGLILFRVSKIKLKDISFVVGITAGFLVFNTILLYLFSPQHGVEIYGTRHFLFGSGKYAPTAEELFYILNYVLKSISSIPVILLFVCTTNPSEFAASLNKIHVPYSIAYSVSLALRYIPDIQREYHDISQSQQARGIEMSKKENIIKRLKAASAILIPLILSSMERVEVVSNAMELRGFGKNNNRTWYMERPFSKWDFLSIALCVLLLVVSILLNRLNGGRYWNPFT